MITHPTAPELLRAAIAWQESPAASAGGYLALVARNALNIVLRELELAPEADRRATARLQTLLNLQADLPTLEAELAHRLRTGALDETSPGLLAHLRLHTLDRLAIDQPRYRHALRAPP